MSDCNGKTTIRNLKSSRLIISIREQEYALEFPVPRGILGFQKETLNFNYTVRDFPQVAYVVPGKDEASISIDSDFKITFDHSVHDFNINFEMDPEGVFSGKPMPKKRHFGFFRKTSLPTIRRTR